jgi:hypothetical protein
VGLPGCEGSGETIHEGHPVGIIIMKGSDAEAILASRPPDGIQAPFHEVGRVGVLLQVGDEGPLPSFEGD